MATLKAAAKARRRNWPVVITDKDGPESARRSWAARPASERVAAVSFLRSQYFVLRGYKKPPRLERVMRILDSRH